MLVDGGDAVSLHEAGAETTHATAAVLQAQEHRPLEVARRHRQLGFGDAVGQHRRHHVVDDAQGFAGPLRCRAAVDREVPESSKAVGWEYTE